MLWVKDLSDSDQSRREPVIINGVLDWKNSMDVARSGGLMDYGWLCRNQVISP